jgi:hypothetical protein
MGEPCLGEPNPSPNTPCRFESVLAHSAEPSSDPAHSQKPRVRVAWYFT